MHRDSSRLSVPDNYPSFRAVPVHRAHPVEAMGRFPKCLFLLAVVPPQGRGIERPLLPKADVRKPPFLSLTTAFDESGGALEAAKNEGEN